MASEKQPASPDTANEIYLDASLRHQVGLRRMTTTELQQLLTALEQADRELVTRLRRGLADGDRIPSLLRSLREMRDEAIGQLQLDLRTRLERLVEVELDFENRMITQSLPVELQVAAVNVEQATASILSQPFSGGTNNARNLDQWFSSLGQVDQARLLGAIQQGMIQGEDINSIVRRVAGTAANNYEDGILSVTRRQAQAIVRTAVNHVSNAARESVWDENDDIIAGLKWTATLDGRTTPICQSRDGKVAPIGDKPLPEGSVPLEPPGARPPAHPQCRSVMIAIFDDEAIAASLGTRPYVRDSRTGRQRQVDFRAEARAQVGEETWRNMTPAQRNSAIAARRQAWAAENVGQVPRDVTYQQWLARQPAAFQDEVLGPTRGALFRRGGLQLDQFVDRRGDRLTLEQLADQDPTAFIRAGLNPEEF